LKLLDNKITIVLSFTRTS